MLGKEVSTPSKKSVGKIFTTLCQTGRSMVEILCVLGVIGVLSLVSFVAIRYGLAKAQVNKIAYTVNLQANALLMALEADKLPIDENGDVTLSYNKTENGFALTGFSNDNGTFGLTVHGIPKDVCQQAGQNIPEQAFGMIINAEDEENQIPVGGQVKVGGVCIDTENTLTYYFAGLSVDPTEALSDYLCAELNEQCGQCQTCQNGQCVLVPAGTKDSVCSEETPFCSASGTCICQEGSCGTDKVCDTSTGICVNCPSNNAVQLSSELCAACGNTVYDSGNCYTCPTTTQSKTLNATLCTACGNTFRIGSACYVCNFSSKVSKQYMSADERTSCQACSERFTSNNGNGDGWTHCEISSCPNNGGSSRSSLSFCNGCYEKTGIKTFGIGGTCYACNFSSRVSKQYMSADEKTSCQACGRIIRGNGNGDGWSHCDLN